VVVLYAVAGLLEAAGLVLAFLGFRRTWAEFGTGEPLTKVIARRSRQAVHSASTALRRAAKRLIGRPETPSPITAHVGLVTGSATLSGTGIVTSPLPPVNDDPERFVAALEKRLSEVHSTAVKALSASEKESAKRTTAVDDLRADLVQRIDSVESVSRSIAVGGLVEQVYGWSLIFFGFALATIGDILQVAGK